VKPYIRHLLLLAALLLIAGWIWNEKLRGDPHDGGVLYGNVDIREVELAFRQPGRLQSVHVDEGDRVAQGDLLAELDAQPLREALDRAEAEVQVAQAELQKLLRGSRQQEVRRGEAQVAQAQAALQLAASEYQRQRALKAKGMTSQQALDTATTAKREAEAALAAAQQSLSLLREGARSEDVAAGEARLAAALAARAQAQTALDDARLLAPSDGVIIARIREPGSLLTGSATVLTLSLPDPVYIRAYVPETLLGRVAPGTAVWVRSDSSAQTYAGQIGFVSPRAEFTPKSVETPELRTDLVYRLRIVVTETDGRLLQGMPVTIYLQNPDRT
jgi:HlyD family secretion protein